MIKGNDGKLDDILQGCRISKKKSAESILEETAIGGRDSERGRKESNKNYGGQKEERKLEEREMQIAGGRESGR